MNSPYQHSTALPSTLPPGYLQAAGDIGRQLGSGLASVGQNIAGAIEKYRQNEDERGILSGQVLGSIQDPTLLKYLDQEHVDSISKKIENGTVTNRDLKTFLPEVMIAKERYGRDVESQKLKSALDTAALQQDEARLRIGQMQQEVTNQRAFTNAVMGTPTSRTEQQTTSTPTITLNDINKYLQQGQQAPSQFLQGASVPSMPAMQIPQQLAPAAAPQAPTLPPPARISSGNSANDAVADSLRAFGNGIGNLLSPSSYVPGSQVGSDALIAYRPELNPKYQEQLKSRLAAMSDPNSATANELRSKISSVAAQQAPAPQAAAPAASAAAPAPGQPFFAPKQPDLQPFNGQIDTVGRSGTQTSTQDVQVNLTPKERYANFVSNYVQQGGQINPQLLQQSKEIFGVQPDVKLQALSDDNGRTLGSAIFVDGKLHNFVQAPMLTPEQQIKLKQQTDALTVQIGNQAFLAPTEKEAQDMRASSADVMNVTDKVNKLIALADNPATRVPGTREHALAQQTASELKPHLGKKLFSRLTELEFKTLDDVVADPTKLFSLTNNTKAKLSSLVQSAQSDLVNQAKSLGFNGLTPQQNDNAVTTKTVGGRQVQIRRF